MPQFAGFPPATRETPSTTPSTEIRRSQCLLAGFLEDLFPLRGSSADQARADEKHVKRRLCTRLFLPWTDIAG